MGGVKPLNSLPSTPTPSAKKRSLRFRNHGIIDGKLCNSFSLPHLLKIRRFRFRCSGWSLETAFRGGIESCAVERHPGGDRGYVWVRDPFRSSCGLCQKMCDVFSLLEKGETVDNIKFVPIETSDSCGWSSKVVPLQSGVFHCCNFKLLFFLKPKNTSKSNNTYMGVS